MFLQAAVFIPSPRYLGNHHQKVTVMMMDATTMLIAQVTKRKVTEIIITMTTVKKEKGPLGGILNQGHLSALSLYILPRGTLHFKLFDVDTFFNFTHNLNTPKPCSNQC